MEIAMTIQFRRHGDGWIGTQQIRMRDAQWPAVDLHVTVEGRQRSGHLYPHSFSATLRRGDGGGEISLLLDRRCVSLANVAWQIERNGWADELASLDQEPK